MSEGIDQKIEEQGFAVEGLVGLDTGKALVKVTLGSETRNVECDEALGMALMLIEGAAAAEMDRALFRFLTESPNGVTVDAAGETIMGLREFRSK